MEKVQISKHKLSCLLEVAAQNCAVCPAYYTCENNPDLDCNDVFDKWLEEEEWQDYVED